MVEKGIVYGRFQIMHLKHLEYILAAKMRCKKLYIGITFPDELYVPGGKIADYRTKKGANPMTFFERFEMIEQCLSDFGVSRKEYEILPFPIDRPEVLLQYMPHDGVCFMSVCDEWTKENEILFQKVGIQTETLWRKTPEEKGVTGTEIRQRILAGEKWSDLVPKSVYEYVVSHGIDDRIRFTK